MINRKIPSLTRGQKSLLALGIAAAMPLWAEEGNRQPMLEEVIVTAEHREASVQDTQISISAFSDEAMAELGISNMGDLSNFAPNLMISEQSSGRSGFAINIRGIRQGESQVSFDPAVGMYVDGVLIAKNVGALLDSLDPERIEVLRGPQGTLYGRNTIGGAVNIVTKKPTDELEGKIAATLGSENQQDFRGTLNLPLLPADSAVGALNLRASLGTMDRDGFYRNDFPGASVKELDTVDRNLALVHLQWQPTDVLDVLYSYDYTEVNDAPSPFFVTSVNEASTAIAPRLLKDFIVPGGENDRPSSGIWNSPYSTETEVEGHALTVNYDLSDNLTLSSISAFRAMENFGQGDSDGSSFRMFSTIGDQQEDDIFTQEFRLIGSAVDDKLEYVLGAFLMNEDGAMSVGSELDLAVSRGLPALTGTMIYAENSIDFQNDVWALYGQGTYNLTEQWNVTVGLRYTEEDREMSKIATNFVNGNPGAPTVYPDASGSFDNISGMASLGYQISDDVMTYAKISQGYQSGGFNSRDRLAADFVTGYDEETVLAYEWGFKSFLLDRRFMLNAALFYNDYDDKVVSKFVLDDLGSRNILRNAGVVEIYGAEVEFLAQLDSGVEFGVNYGYTHPEYKKYQDDLGNDLSNSYFPYTPRSNTHAHVGYEFSGIDYGRLSGRIDWMYQGAHHFLAGNPEQNGSSSYDLWNARLTLSEMKGPGNSQVKASLWGKNLTDQSYWSFGVDLFQQGFGWAINGYGDPRTFGVDVAVEF